jgi:hypothetical protein
MDYSKKAEINLAISQFRKKIPITRHRWNNHALELWIEEPDHAEEAKTRLFNSCDKHLKGVMMVLKWKGGDVLGGMELSTLHKGEAQL